MVKVKAPLFSVAASGVFENAIEFRTGSGKSTAHGKRSKPAGRSQAQQAQSARFAEAVSGWKALNATQKAAWKTAGTRTGHTGYQLYLSEYQTQNITAPGQPTPP